MAEIRHLGFWRQNAKTRFSQKLSNLELWCLLTTYTKLGKLNWGFSKNPLLDHYNLQCKMAEIRHLENRHDVIFFCRGWSDLDKISQTSTEWHVDCGDMWKWNPDVELQYGGRLGELNVMSSQSHVSHCSRVLPLGEINVVIVPHCRV